jgi:gliding motility-associated-like protein
VESVLGCVDTVSRMVYVKPMPDPTFEKLLPYYCNHPTFYDFVPVTPGGVFYGENIFQNQFFPIRLWQDTIEYKVTVNGCLDSSKQFTMVYPTPDIDLGADTTLCKYEMLTLDATFWNSTYEWSNKEFTPVIQVHKPGTYRVVVSNLCGKDTSAIQIQYKDHNCRLFLPTAFSPNKDGINEYYRPVVSDISGYTLKIFNRWGELLYEGNQDDKGWDGTFRGQVCMPGVYLAQVHYHYPLRTSVKHLYENTTLMLIR